MGLRPILASTTAYAFMLGVALWTAGQPRAYPQDPAPKLEPGDVIETEPPKFELGEPRTLDVHRSVSPPIFKRAGQDAIPPMPENPAFARRLKDQNALVADGGGSKKTQDAVAAALAWLARHQQDSGPWRARLDCKDCQPHGVSGTDDFETGLTGLALLAFLGRGHGPDSAAHGKTVVKAADFLLKSQAADGALGDRSHTQHMYEHALATAALSELAGHTGAEKYRQPAEKAVAFLLEAQNPGKGWRYGVKPGENDSSVTGWAVLALKAARAARIEIDPAAHDGARAWFDEVSYLDGAGRTRAGYQFAAEAFVMIPGSNDSFNDHPTTTAMMALSRLLIDEKKDDALSSSLEVVALDPPTWDGAAIDFYYWHVGAQALFHGLGPRSEAWQAWNLALVDALIDHQESKDHKAGSWEPVDRWSCRGGRVYATALNALTLQTYYRYRGALREKSG